MTENDIGTVLVDAAIVVHRELGPGLLESVYEAILARELEDRGLVVDRQVAVAITYRGSSSTRAFARISSSQARSSWSSSQFRG